ncbi:hypothetical protein Bbelb_026190 [Branchiostoma belcheri]|nr:hypothetical protein Bbelb_026190 [Branchiostoma belcheri]
MPIFFITRYPLDFLGQHLATYARLDSDGEIRILVVGWSYWAAPGRLGTVNMWTLDALDSTEPSASGSMSAAERRAQRMAKLQELSLKRPWNRVNLSVLDSVHDKGIEIQPKRSRRYPAVNLTDLDFADDLALVAQLVKDAESLLQSLEKAASYVGLYCNEAKTEFISTSTSTAPEELKSLSGTCIKQVVDFKYLGSYIMDSDRDFTTRKAFAWETCNRLDNIWCSSVSNDLKLQVFRTIVEPILLYGAETWTLTTRLENKLDGTYTRLLRRAQNMSWKQHPTMATIYGKLPLVSHRLKQRRVRFAGHCFMASGEIISSLSLWRPSGKSYSRKLTYPRMISRYTGFDIDDLKSTMADRSLWSTVVQQLTLPDRDDR